MRRDATVARGERPFVFTDLRHGVGLDAVIEFVERATLLDARP
jgi:urease accessory protein